MSLLETIAAMYDLDLGLEPSKPGVCCGVKMDIDKTTRYYNCSICGSFERCVGVVFEKEQLPPNFYRMGYAFPTIYNSSKHVSSFLRNTFYPKNVSKEIKKKFDDAYINEIKGKCAGAYTLKNIHQSMRTNNDHRYLYYAYYLLTGHMLEICPEDIEKIEHIYRTCKKEPDLIHVRLPVMHVIKVLAEVDKSMAHLRPYLYSPFKLDCDRFNLIKGKYDKLLRSGEI